MSAIQIELEEASAGMVLAEALLDSHGGVLLPPGAVLSESTLASLRRRGIAGCSVLAPQEPDGEDASDPALAAARAQQRLQRLQHLFRHSADTEATGQLLRLLAAYRSRS
ncbi:hypothetical protein [Pseudoduganella aquatica]|uniref:Uncharacterized protein n=1 Tax=Pseudoduganella aquatica TaxID=2660641 RepID=A0A7X4KQ90_9BURK|nr:hypothetical protein [Pseudoduganella aquatica]MYN11098.1 hypothetical protein [Pseudoduganella aquatica]